VQHSKAMGKAQLRRSRAKYAIRGPLDARWHERESFMGRQAPALVASRVDIMSSQTHSVGLKVL
jgi:hypothetical protein